MTATPGMPARLCLSTFVRGLSGLRERASHAGIAAISPASRYCVSRCTIGMRAARQLWKKRALAASTRSARSGASGMVATAGSRCPRCRSMATTAGTGRSTPRSIPKAGNLLPRHERGVDHVRHALAADRADREVHVLEREAVGRDLLQRKALGCELRESELAGPVAVAARALDGDEFHRDPLEREIRKFLHFALDHDRPALALQRFHAEQDREGPGARGAVERDVDAFASRDLLDAREGVLLLHVDHVVGAQFFRDLHPRGVLGGARDDDERGARLLADDGLRQPLLTGPLDK